MKILERNKAIELRTQGKTFREILGEVSVSRGSLSYWLKDIKLTPQQLARIQYKNDKIKEQFIKFNELKRIQSESNKSNITTAAIREIGGISVNELKLIGIALYWAEGYKGRACGGAEFTNTDAAMIKLMMRWFRQVCRVPEGKFRIRIQIHDIKNIEAAKGYWSEITGIPISQFNKPYLKTSPTSRRKVGHVTPWGICNIRISDIDLITRIQGWIKGLSGAIV